MSQIIFHYLTTQKGDWNISVHSPHGDKDYHMKHVHVMKRGEKGEYSWNIDGTRHDKHKFPKNEKYIVRAKKIAAEALGISPGILQLVTVADNYSWYKVISIQDDGREELFRMYIYKNQIVVALISDKGLITVLIPKEAEQ